MESVLVKINFCTEALAYSVYSQFLQTSAWIDFCARYEARSVDISGSLVTLLITSESDALKKMHEAYSHGFVIFRCREYAVCVG